VGRRLGGPHSQSECSGEDKNPLMFFLSGFSPFSVYYLKFIINRFKGILCSMIHFTVIPIFLISYLIQTACMGEGKGVYRVLVGRPKGKRSLGRPRHMWEDNIKMHLREIGIDEANWIQVAQDRVQWQAFVSTVMNLWVPSRKQTVV
jgi:hypothetical protein